MNGDKFYYQNDPGMSSADIKFILDLDNLKLSDIIRRNTRIRLSKGANVFFAQ